MREVRINEAIEFPHRHHVFPKEFRTWFEERGFTGERDIDNFTVELARSDHEGIHGGGDWKLARRVWPGEWSQRVMHELRKQESDLGRKLTFEEAKERVEKLMVEYRIPQQFVPFKRR